MIRVLIVEDSPVTCRLLQHILSSDADIAVIGTAANGREAVEFVARNPPDLVTMDIQMPEMDGFEAARIIMESHPVPIVMVTANADMREFETSFRAIAVGALTVLQKPPGIGHPNHEKSGADLIATIKLMSEIKVVRRWGRATRKVPSPLPEPGYDFVPPPAPIRVVAMGASTGGPPVIEKILAGLPREFPAPILIVQHMAEGFIRGFAEWLGQTSSLPVHVPLHGSMTRPGHVYLAPDNMQMKMDAAGRISCRDEAPENGLRPSVSYLLRSVAEVFGSGAVGVLLTGMGKDGAGELKVLKESGAATIAQNEESSAVFGMPGEAVKLGAAQYILPADKIAAVLTGIVMAKNRKERIRQRPI